MLVTVVRKRSTLHFSRHTPRFPFHQSVRTSELRPALQWAGISRLRSGSRVRLPQLTCRGAEGEGGGERASQKVAVELPYRTQAWRFTVPGIAEIRNVGCGPSGVSWSFQRLCEAGPCDRGCWFHVGNGVAGQVVAPQNPQSFPAALLALATWDQLWMSDKGRVLMHDRDHPTFSLFPGLQRSDSFETATSLKRLLPKTKVLRYCPLSCVA